MMINKILIAFAIFTLPVISFSQDTTDTDNYQYFVVQYTLGENWDTTKQTHEQRFFNDHSTHLSELRKSGKISLGGFYGETGMIIIKVKNEKEAQEIISKDPSVQNKIFNTKIFLFDPFYSGCIE
ncbi:MAG: hypothetical protein AB7O73_03600 [Bacteroidia bacterium]